MVTLLAFSAVLVAPVLHSCDYVKGAYPSMKKYGLLQFFWRRHSIAAGGTLVIIPPSIILMIYGILTQTNIGQLFGCGCVIPGFWA